MPTPTRTIAPLALGIALALTACGGDGTSARDEAVDRATEQGLRRDIAECVVDASIEEWGEASLDPAFELDNDQIGRSVEILDGCLFSE